MSIGMKGSMTREMATLYAISCTFSIAAGPARNRQSASCKVCGATIPTDQGVAFLVGPGHLTNRCYLCTECLSWVKQATDAWLEFARTHQD